MARRLPQTITRDEFARLLAAPSKTAPTGVRNAAALSVMWNCGLRVAELCDLAAGDVRRQDRDAPSIRVRRGKGGVDRNNLPMPADTLALVERWADRRPSSRYFFSTLAGNRMHERYVGAMVARYARRAEVFKLTADNGEVPINPHMLRHSYATRLVNGGAPIHAAQRALGHASLSTTQRYLHVRDDELAATLRALGEADEGGETAGLRRMVRDELEALLAR